MGAPITVSPIPLQPGDCLLYTASSLFGLIIQIKSWHRESHCEAYVGDGWSVASRDGIGVGRYPVRLDGLIQVLRPVQPFNRGDARRWFTTVEGQGYDWRGLLRFGWRSGYLAGTPHNRQFCSEFLTRWYRAGGLDPFNGDDADAIAPFEFAISPVFARVWSATPPATPAPGE